MSVPEDAEILISMRVDTWAFGQIDGRPIGETRAQSAPRRTGTE